MRMRVEKGFRAFRFCNSARDLFNPNPREYFLCSAITRLWIMDRSKMFNLKTDLAQKKVSMLCL